MKARGPHRQFRGALSRLDVRLPGELSSEEQEGFAFESGFPFPHDSL